MDTVALQPSSGASSQLNHFWKPYHLDGLFQAIEIVHFDTKQLGNYSSSQAPKFQSLFES